MNTENPIQSIDRLDDFQLAILIRAVEEKFLELFSKGLLSGTVHTCIGQELSAVAICKYLNQNDYVFSNHRCHGHYISFTKEYESLISELMGKKNGVCGGVGGSQHLYKNNFFSNGPQGALSPVATGVGYGLKLLNKTNKSIAVCFIGDGTLGEGILYESMNIAALYKIPILFVCEDNKYAQSTSIKDNLSGSIIERAAAFGLKTFDTSTWDFDDLKNNTSEAIKNARNRIPGFIKIDTYRLRAHSKGDDDRDIDEIKHYKNIDLINLKLQNDKKSINFYQQTLNVLDSYINKIKDDQEITIKDYLGSTNSLKNKQSEWDNHDISIKNKQVDQINNFFHQIIEIDDKTILIGEDIKDPYGGAFKVTKGISDKKENNVISTPISEAGIVGMGVGLSLIGFKPYVEIMFGDFTSYCFDQILSNASKFYHMYNKQINVPLVLRTPMGGGRGYGPTHSQSIEKFFNGINNIKIIALNTLVNPLDLYKEIHKNQHTTFVIENKLDYGRIENELPKSIEYEFFKSNHSFPVIVGKPKNLLPDICIITYGGAVHPVLESVDKIFFEFELIAKIIVLTSIYPLQTSSISQQILDSKIILTVEEGNIEGGFGSEIITSLIELCTQNNKTYRRIGSENIPIPSVKNLEKKTLINSEKIIDEIRGII